MTDVHSKETRSYNMSRIKSKDTTPELIVRNFLWSKGLRYRLHDKRFPGSPDLVFPKYKTMVFVHGCFWHMHDYCKFFVMPKSNTEFWEKKLQRNKIRDLIVIEELEKMGWKVLVIWECEIKSKNYLSRLEELFYQITNG